MDQARWLREWREIGRKRESATERRKQNPTESAEHRTAEGMVGWIQLLGEQYCLAVIVCSSTCSGFPGLGPRAYHRVPLHHDILFAYYNTDEDEDESEDEDENNYDEDCYSTDSPRRPWHRPRMTSVYILDSSSSFCIDETRIESGDSDISLHSCCGSDDSFPARAASRFFSGERL